MAEMSIGAAFDWWAAVEPDGVAVSVGDRALARGELAATADLLARRWISDGLKTDDLVTIALPNGLDFAVAAVAAWKAGATPQPLSPHLPDDERETLIALSQPFTIVDEPLDLDRSAAPVDRPTIGDRRAASWRAAASSGSTGAPKLICSTAPAVVDPSVPAAHFIPRRATQLVAGPLFHAGPFTYAMRGLMTGHTLVLMEEFDPVEWLRLVGEHEVTWAVLVPAMMRGIADLPRLPHLTDLSVLHFGARCPAPLKRTWIDWLGPDRVVEVFASTESAGVTSIDGAEWLEHPGSVGRGVGGSQFRITRPDGSVASTDEVGEIWMRRGGPTYRYIGAEPRERDGWHSVGDTGWIDEEGFLYLADRIEDLITTSTGQVRPADVEAVLDSHPEVRSSVVVGRGGEEGGTHVHAVLEAGASLDLESVEAWTRERLERDQVPRSWERTGTRLRDDTGKSRRSAWR